VGTSLTREFVLGVDLDGVCADYTAGLRSAVARHRGVEPDTLPEAVSWDYAEWDLDRETFLEHHRRAVVEDHLFANVPAMAGVAESLWRLSDAGVWIRIITHRLVANWNHATAVADTVTWLDEQRIPYRDICFLGTKPEIEADAYIEDAPHNIEALRRSGNTVVVFDQPYNRHLSGPRAHDWPEAERLIGDLVLAAEGVLEQTLPGVDPGADRLDAHRRPPGSRPPGHQLTDADESDRG
jgi:5'(3')-deoxyribonucleotidase